MLISADGHIKLTDVSMEVWAGDVDVWARSFCLMSLFTIAINKPTTDTRLEGMITL